MSGPTRNTDTNKFVAILLGASDWPDVSSLDESPAFELSKDRFKKYLIDELGLVEQDTLLDLFDSDDSFLEVDKKIRDFLKKNSSDGKPNFSDLIFFYTGHGDFSKTDQNFQVVLRSTSDERRDMTGYKMRDLAASLNEHARRAQKLVILDCCFAKGALPAFMRLSDGDLATAVPEKILLEAEMDFAPPLLPTDDDAFLDETPGTLLLCAAAEDQWGANPNYGNHPISAKDRMTMFSYGFVKSIEEGIKQAGEKLSIEELHNNAVRVIGRTFPNDYVKPILVPAVGDRDFLVKRELFPNAAAKLKGIDRRIEDLEQKLTSALTFLSATDAEVKSLKREAIPELRKKVQGHHKEIHQINQRLGGPDGELGSQSLSHKPDHDAPERFAENQLVKVPAPLYRALFHPRGKDEPSIYMPTWASNWLLAVLEAKRNGRYFLLFCFTALVLAYFCNWIYNSPLSSEGTQRTAYFVVNLIALMSCGAIMYFFSSLVLDIIPPLFKKKVSSTENSFTSSSEGSFISFEGVTNIRLREIVALFSHLYELVDLQVFSKRCVRSEVSHTERVLHEHRGTTSLLRRKLFSVFGIYLDSVCLTLGVGMLFIAAQPGVGRLLDRMLF